MKKLIHFPWYVFVLPIFYVLHAYNEYFALITAGVFFYYLVFYLALAGVIFLVAWPLLKNKIKAGVWTVSALLIFFFFGPVYDFLQRNRFPSFLLSYTFLLILIVVVLIALFILLRKKKVPVRANRFLSLLFLLLILIEIGTSFYYIVSDKEKKNNPAGFNTPIVDQPVIPDKSQMPDIFFFVFDEYASSASLKKYQNFDNSALDSTLTRDSFFIASGSQSNYNATSLSLASTFHLAYLNKPLEGTPPDTYSLLGGSYALEKSVMPGLLKKHGYQIINHGLFHLDKHPAPVETVLLDYEKKVFSLGTLSGRIKRDIWWNVIVRMPGFKKERPADARYIKRNQDNYNGFLQELKRESDTARFVYGHVLLPRRPTYVDRYGQPRIVSNTDFTDKNYDTLYLQQVLYANKLIDSLAQAATQKRNRPLVLIIEGDHGNRYGDWGLHIREKQFMNLSLYYFSDKDYTRLYKTISPVNSFRVVLNKYFAAGLPLLKDSTILLK